MKSQLKQNHRLFRELATNPPVWWKNLIKDKEVYCDVRKDNYINVYCNGGSIMKLSWDGGFKAEIHFKYIPLKGDRTYRKFEFDDGNIALPNPGIIDIDNFSKGPLNRVKARVKQFHPNNSEKGIQGRYVTKTLESKARNGFFVDSEFEYEKKRIDLVWVDLDLKMIAFVELKTRSDARLYMETGPDSDAIDGQLKKYADFIKENKADLLKYYDLVYQIKKELGLLKGYTRHTSLKKFTLLEKPILLVGDCTKKWIDKNADTIGTRVSDYAYGVAFQGSNNFRFFIPKKAQKKYFLF